MMILREIEIKCFALISKLLEAEFGDNPKEIWQQIFKNK